MSTGSAVNRDGLPGWDAWGAPQRGSRVVDVPTGVMPALHAAPEVGAAARTRTATVVAGVSTRAGQGLSTFLLNAAWDLAADRDVLLVDLDESGGTVAESLHLSRAVVAAHSVEALYTGEVVTADRLAANSVGVRGRPRLRVVPGRAATSCGPGLDAILPRLTTALRTADADVVLLDLGPCLAYPGLVNPDAVVSAIRRVAGRVVCVLAADPLPFQHAMQVMRRLGDRLLPDVVVWRWERRWSEELVASWQGTLPGIPIRSVVDWDGRAYAASLLSGRPVADVGRTVRRDLRL